MNRNDAILWRLFKKLVAGVLLLLVLATTSSSVLAEEAVDEIHHTTVTPQSPPPHPCSDKGLVLVTGATGSVGKIAIKLLLERGFCVRAMSRNKDPKDKFRHLLQEYDQGQLEFVQGDLGNAEQVEAAFLPTMVDGSDSIPIRQVLFCAGGEDADYNAVNKRGVAACAKQAAKVKVQSMVVISAAWVSMPYSLASLLFNSLYPSRPMALHLQGEEFMKETLQAAKVPYVILRAGRLVADADYPPTAASGISLEQGDGFAFFGPAGVPGMCHTQLAFAVVSALTSVTNEGGQYYTAEVTSGSMDATGKDASSLYAGLQVDEPMTSRTVAISQDDIMYWHVQALQQVKYTCLSLVVIFLVLLFRLGWKRAMFTILLLDLLCLLVWSQWISALSVMDLVQMTNGGTSSSSNNAGSEF